MSSASRQETFSAVVVFLPGFCFTSELAAGDFYFRGGFVMRGIINIIIGLVMVIGGLSGALVMRGTNSSLAIVAIGGVLIALGGFRLISSFNQE